MQYPQRAELGDSCMKLHSALECLAMWHTKFAMAPALTEDVDVKDDVVSSKTTLAEGSAALATIAGLNVLYQFSGSEQKEQVKKLHDKLHEMPGALATKLRKICPPPKDSVAKKS